MHRRHLGGSFEEGREGELAFLRESMGLFLFLKRKEGKEREGVMKLPTSFPSTTITCCCCCC